MSEKNHPLARARHWRAGRAGRALLVIAAISALSLGAAAPASAATTSSLRYSTDGGATWTTSATVPAGGTVLVRQWYDNTGSSNETAASLRTTIPSGFSLQGGSTKICLNPSTTNPSSPNASEQTCASSAEGSVWSGSDLQISPSAGFYGESNGSTSGTTSFGRKRYFNLQQCLYYKPSVGDYFTLVNDASNNSFFRSTTNVANTAGASCVGVGSGSSTSYTISGHSGVKSLGLLGNRYVNLHQCTFINQVADDNLTVFNDASGNAAFRSGTNSSNTADATRSCTAGGGNYTLQSGHSGVQVLDLLSNRYLNLHQCVYGSSAVADIFTTATNVSSSASFDAGTNASNTQDTTESCGAGGGSNNFAPRTGDNGVSSFDLLDTTRGAGYVQYALTAPENPSPAACAGTFNGTEGFTQPTSYVSTQSGTIASTGSVTVDFSALSDPCPTDPIPSVDPAVGAGLVATAAAGYVLYRRRRHQVA